MITLMTGRKLHILDTSVETVKVSRRVEGYYTSGKAGTG